MEEGERAEQAEAESAAEQNSCSICLEPWTSRGAHRLCSLKCGHLFGLHCLELWLKRRKQCPTCKKKVSSSDIRPLFGGARLVVVDKEREETLRQELLSEAAKRERAEAEVETLKLKVRSLEDELARRLAPPPVTRKRAVGALAESIDRENRRRKEDEPLILRKLAHFKVAEARAIEFSCDGHALHISRKRDDACYDMTRCHVEEPTRLVSFMQLPLHQGAIRDIRDSPFPSKKLTMTASLDKTVVLTDHESFAPALKYRLETPALSCCWGPESAHVVYAGGADSSVVAFDLRQTRSALCQIRPPTRCGPVHSIMWNPSDRSVVASTPMKAFTTQADSGAGSTVRMFDQPGHCHSLSMVLGDSSSFCASYRDVGNAGSAHLLQGDLNRLVIADPEPSLRGHQSPAVMSRTTSWRSSGQRSILSANDKTGKLSFWNESGSWTRVDVDIDVHQTSVTDVRVNLAGQLAACVSSSFVSLLHI